MRTVFRIEWKRILRNPALLVILGFFLLAGLYTIYNGGRIIQTQLVKIDSLEAAYDTLFNSSLAKFDADTTTKQGKADYSNASNPASVNYRITPVTVLNPNSFSVLSIGQREIQPIYRKISTEKSLIQPYEPDISNPELLTEGFFDFSFLVLYLVPLLVISLCFNVISEEKESGTYLILFAQSPRPYRIFFYKLIFRGLIVLSLLYVLGALGIYWSSTFLPVRMTDISTWFTVVTSYLVFWFSLTCVFISLQRSSLLTAFLLSCSWLVFTIIIPFGLNFYIEMRHPLGLRADLASHQRKIEEAVWDIPPGQLINAFYVRHPEYKTGNVGDTFQYSPRRFAAYYDELEKRLLPIAAVYSNRIESRNLEMNRLAGYDPVLHTQNILNQIGVSGMENFRRFDQSSHAFERQWQYFIYHFIFTDRDLTIADYGKFPKYFSVENNRNYTSHITGSLSLLVWALLLLCASVPLFKKNKPK